MLILIFVFSLGGCVQCSDDTIELLGKVSGPNLRYLNLSGCNKLKGPSIQISFFSFPKNISLYHFFRTLCECDYKNEEFACAVAFWV